VLSTEALERHFRAYPRTDREVLPVGGVLQWRRDGEYHIWNPDTIAKLQHSVRGQNGDPATTYEEFARWSTTTRRARRRCAA
jgi:glutamate synthase domain-containing protein 2